MSTEHWNLPEGPPTGHVRDQLENQMNEDSDKL